ncbi:hypothetical protein GBK02_15835 [Dechloromonas sp. TW-R-39-2]|uniref:hypothetical protein n=1 Tax=Dechloromonas sp. TW-R-39-2 TaxID=2654218 RepID=UPI00193CCA49|nr:hypothetical protein [Dechloromonas sp. TW-R-39-2]QRM20740.1 hypothetical protein GBK02_15835 [Dechloromonas sp. TW-R-39-2]
MAKISKVFPLDFNAQEWTVEEALPWVFFGDDSGKGIWKEQAEFNVQFVVGEADERSNNIHLKTCTRRLQKYFREHGEVRRCTAFSPLVWCRLAIQFWLMLGGRQEAFMSAMTDWIKTKNKGGKAFVAYCCATTGKKGRMPMEAFLFGGDELPDLKATEWKYKQKAATLPPHKVESQRSKVRTDEDQVGANILVAVKHAVSEVIGKKRGESLYLRGTDKKTGKKRYRGTKYDLLEEICPAGKDSGGRWRLANGNGISLYAESTLMKAISKVAICRKSWPG